MRLAIYSDIHGNLEALEAVLERCAELGVDRTVCLGDVVGYGADPNACVERVRAGADVVLAGNHDRAAVGVEEPRFFNPVALAAVRWTSKTLLETHALYLRKRPMVSERGDVLFVHSSPYRPEAWHYLFLPEEGRSALLYADARFCFVGHSHHAFICSESGRAEAVGEGGVRIEDSERYLVNVGSVGQPRDSDPRAAFLLWDEGELRLCRVPYDIAGAQAKIRSAGLPEILAERLELGR